MSDSARTPLLRRPAQSWWAAGVAWALTAVLLLALGVRAWRYIYPARALPPVPAVHGDALADYVPEDAAAVFSLDVRALVSSPLLRPPGPDGRREPIHLEPALRGVLDLLGVDFEKDVQNLRIIYFLDAASGPLALGRGSFDADRFRTKPGALEEGRAGPGGRYRVFRHVDPKTGHVTHLAPAPPFLLSCTDEARVVAALAYAGNPRPVPPHDDGMRRLLEGVDRGQALWLAIRLDRLGKVPPLENKVLELALRPILKYASGVRGGVTVGDELRAEFRFEAADVDRAEKLEKDLNNVRDLAKGARHLIKFDKDKRAALDLVGSGRVRREGTTVHLQCRWAP